MGHFRRKNKSSVLNSIDFNNVSFELLKDCSGMDNESIIEIEKKFIIELNTLYPNGLNLNYPKGINPDKIHRPKNNKSLKKTKFWDSEFITQ